MVMRGMVQNKIAIKEIRQENKIGKTEIVYNKMLVRDGVKYNGDNWNDAKNGDIRDGARYVAIKKRVGNKTVISAMS